MVAGRVLPLVLFGVCFSGASPVPAGDAAPGGLLLVANKGDHTLSVVDPGSGRELARLEESGVTGHEVVASPDGRFAWVPIYGNSGVGRPGTDGRTIDVFDLVALKRVETVDLGRPERPHCPQFGRDGRLYVTTELTDSLTVLDPATRRVVDQVPTGARESHMAVLSRDGRRAFTSNVGSGSVSILDVAAKKVQALVPVSALAQRIALSRDERWVFTADQKAPRLAVIDASKARVSRFVPLPGVAYGTDTTPDARFLLAALPSERKVALVDLRTWQVVRTIEVPRSPQEVLVRPDGRVAYVSCDASAKVAEIDLERWTLLRLIDAGPQADGLAWANVAP